jgi:hypothetical protein
VYRWVGKSDPDFCVLLLLVCQLDLAKRRVGVPGKKDIARMMMGSLVKRILLIIGRRKTRRQENWPRTNKSMMRIGFAYGTKVVPEKQVSGPV